jgi:hypothetical protein
VASCEKKCFYEGITQKISYMRNVSVIEKSPENFTLPFTLDSDYDEEIISALSLDFSTFHILRGSDIEDFFRVLSLWWQIGGIFFLGCVI